VNQEELKSRIAALVAGGPHQFKSEQDQAAIRLGYSSYEFYRSCLLWQTIKRRVLQRDRRICRCCWFQRATEVHHHSYADDVMRGLNDVLLSSVCKDCHHLIHYDGSRWRKTWEEREMVFAC
jgi:hypothetical protein